MLWEVHLKCLSKRTRLDSLQIVRKLNIETDAANYHDKADEEISSEYYTEKKFCE